MIVVLQATAEAIAERYFRYLDFCCCCDQVIVIGLICKTFFIVRGLHIYFCLLTTLDIVKTYPSQNQFLFFFFTCTCCFRVVDLEKAFDSVIASQCLFVQRNKSSFGQVSTWYFCNLDFLKDISNFMYKLTLLVIHESDYDKVLPYHKCCTHRVWLHHFLKTPMSTI